METENITPTTPAPETAPDTPDVPDKEGLTSRIFDRFANIALHASLDAYFDVAGDDAEITDADAIFVSEFLGDTLKTGFVPAIEASLNLKRNGASDLIARAVVSGVAYEIGCVAGHAAAARHLANATPSPATVGGATVGEPVGQ